MKQILKVSAYTKTEAVATLLRFGKKIAADENYHAFNRFLDDLIEEQKACNDTINFK